MMIRANRRLGQHLLAGNVLDEEVMHADLRPDDVVLEIGAGPGNLTEKLAVRCPVIAIEKDSRFIPGLRKLGNVTVIEGDARDVLSAPPRFTKIVSNIPYMHSQELLLALLRLDWSKAVLAVQKEFAEKLVGKTRLGMLLRDCGDARIARHISRTCFTPQPRSDSSLVILEQRKRMDDAFWKFLSVYNKKNKDVKRALKAFPSTLARKKVHQLTYKEIKALYEMNMYDPHA